MISVGDEKLVFQLMVKVSLSIFPKRSLKGSFKSFIVFDFSWMFSKERLPDHI